MLFGIFIYPGGEPIDLASFGLLSIAKRIRPEIELCTIAPYGGLTVLNNGLCVLADYGIARAPGLDILVVTGGPGWIDQSRAPETLAFIRRQAAAIPIVPVSHGRTDRHSQRHSRRKGGDDRARRRALRTVDARTAAR